MKKQYDEVLALLSKAIEIDPNFAIGYKNRGLVYLELNNKTAACSDFIAGSNLGNQEAKQLQQQHCR
ncbi:MAG: tetratricopeptide repeat protein [Bacteroidetes bacterium]|nr:tetratricopeptide repeat protein [Bacteroidota bacterium]